MKKPCDSPCTSKIPKWVAPPKPDVRPLDKGGDLVWVASCSLDQLISLFLDPMAWMRCLSCRYDPCNPKHDTLTLAPHYVISMQPIDPKDKYGKEAAKLLTRAATKPELAFSALTEGDSARAVLAPAFRKRVQGFIDGLPQAEQLKKAVVQGISGTGVITIVPSAKKVAQTLLDRPEWLCHWETWCTNHKDHPLEVTSADQEGRCYGHLQILGKKDLRRSEKIAAFLMYASRSVGHMNRLLAKPKECQAQGRGFEFKKLDVKSLASTQFLYQDREPSEDRACEVFCASMDEGEASLECVITKGYV